MKDYTIYPVTNTYFGGSERKLGIIMGDEEYMIKFQKVESFGKRNNHLSEFLGSNIYELLGFDVQETSLGTYKNDNVVCCKNFVPKGYLFVPFNDVGESSLEQDANIYQYSYEDIMRMLQANKKLTDLDECITIFWDMFIVDALLGNFDRHGSNWGFLKKDNKYKMCPIFDNGSSLYPSMIDENKMLMIMNDKEETDERIYRFPTSQIKLNNNKSSYYEVISSLMFKECNDALIKIYNRICLDKINKLIDNVENISDIHKEFYKYMIFNRYNKIIKFSYDKLMEKTNEK